MFFQRLRFIAQPKWWLVVCLIVGLALITGFPVKQVSAQAITITPPTGKTEFFLAPETEGQSLITTTGLVTSTAKPFDVTAVDKMDAGKLTGDAGKMVEWDGSAWGSGKLTSVVKVGSTIPGYGQPPADLSDSPITIIANHPKGKNLDAEITVTITTVAGDVGLTEAGHWYRIVITFTASEYT